MHLFPINLMQTETDSIRIAITSDSANHRNYLQKTMEQRGIEVVLNESLTKQSIEISYRPAGREETKEAAQKRR